MNSNPQGMTIVGAALLAACQGAPAPAPSPAPSVSAATSAPAAASASAAPVDQSVAKPLSERGARLLESDMHLRMERADQFGFQFNPDPRKIVEEDTFLLVAGDKSAPLDEAAAQVHRTVEALWRGPFFHKPEAGVTVWVFSKRADYEKFRQLYATDDSSPKDLSFYRPSDRWIFFCPEGSGWGTLNHESPIR